MGHARKIALPHCQETITTAPQLTPEQEAEAQRIATVIGKKIQDESLSMARLLVSKADPDFFGTTEFEVRDRMMRRCVCRRSG